MSATIGLRTRLAELEQRSGATAPAVYCLDVEVLGPDDETPDEQVEREARNALARNALDAFAAGTVPSAPVVLVKRLLVWYRPGAPAPAEAAELPLDSEGPWDELVGAGAPDNSQEPRGGDFALPPLREAGNTPAAPLEPVVPVAEPTELAGAVPPLWSPERAASEARALGWPALAVEAPALNIGGPDATRRRAEELARSAAQAGSALRIRLYDCD